MSGCEGDEEGMPPLLDDNPPQPLPAASTPTTTREAHQEEDSDASSSGWEEMEEALTGSAQCLFCSNTVQDATTCIAHMLDCHGFDLAAFVCGHRLDQVGYIKLVNFVRRSRPSPGCLLALDSTTAAALPPWEASTNLKPVLQDDALIMFDVEGLPGWQGKGRGEEGAPGDAYPHATREELQQVVMKQREVLQRMLQAATSSRADSKREEGWQRTVGDMRPEEDEGYFNSYAHFDIHHEMLSDRVRTEAYRDAILNNATLLRGKRVLDLGCGTSILSMFSARAGATVTAVDMSEVIYQAMDIVKENQLEDSISLYKGRLEDLHFQQRFDYIVSEWMGYFLLFEGMLDSVLHARDHHLAPGGLLLPNRCSLHLLGLQDMASYNKLISFWDDVYGFKMSCMRKEVVKEASTDIVKEECIITSSAQIANFDLMAISPSDTEFSSLFSLTVTRPGQLTGFAGYFDAFFDMPRPVSFSTGPLSPPTHWKQTLFYLPQPRPVLKGEVVEGSISVRRKRREVRSLEVTITCGGHTHKYLVE